MAILKFERERIAEQPQHGQDAYELYQRGVCHHYRHTGTDNIEAQRLFRAALAIDPDYPQTLRRWRSPCSNAGYLGWAEDEERNYEESFRLAQRAVALDGRYPAAHFAFAMTSMYTNRFDRAVAEMRQAIELNASYAQACAILGHMLTYAGQPEETVALVEKAIRLKPQ